MTYHFQGARIAATDATQTEDGNESAHDGENQEKSSHRGDINVSQLFEWLKFMLPEEHTSSEVNQSRRDNLQKKLKNLKTEDFKEVV